MRFVFSRDRLLLGSWLISVCVSSRPLRLISEDIDASAYDRLQPAQNLVFGQRSDNPVYLLAILQD